MAEDRYGDYGRREGWRERGSSIFSDDDDERRRRASARWPRDPDRDEEERGFLERAGDELRSWFGDEEAERRRELDMQRDDARYAFGRDYGRRSGGPPPSRTPHAGFGRSEQGVRRWSGDEPDEATGYGQRSFGGRSGLFGRSQWDENYRLWRDRQIEQFDREYEEYCRERQRRFDQDFDTWRTSRPTEGGATGHGRDTSRAQDRAGATTSAGGVVSASGASTGSSDAPEPGQPARGRGSRTRT